MLQELFKRIQEDKRHYDVIKIFEKPIETSEFPEYKVDFLSLDSRYREEDLNKYFTQKKSLQPAIQTSVKYVPQKFAEGIK